MKQVVKSALEKKNDFAYRSDTEGYLIYELIEALEDAFALNIRLNMELENKEFFNE